MKSLAFSLIAAAAAASDANTITTGPTTTAITRSTITITPKVQTALLTVTVTSTWLMAAELADTNVVEWTGCFQYCTSEWYCMLIRRTVAAGVAATD